MDEVLAKADECLAKAKQEGLIDVVCKACALQANAAEAAQQEGIPLADDASGHVSLFRYVEQGYQVITL